MVGTSNLASWNGHSVFRKNISWWVSVKTPNQKVLCWRQWRNSLHHAHVNTSWSFAVNIWKLLAHWNQERVVPMKEGFFTEWVKHYKHKGFVKVPLAKRGFLVNIVFCQEIHKACIQWHLHSHWNEKFLMSTKTACMNMAVSRNNDNNNNNKNQNNKMYTKLHMHWKKENTIKNCTVCIVWTLFFNKNRGFTFQMRVYETSHSGYNTHILYNIIYIIYICIIYTPIYYIQYYTVM